MLRPLIRRMFSIIEIIEIAVQIEKNGEKVRLLRCAVFRNHSTYDQYAS